ncbi:MAG: ABC transporter ATP-binding protein [Candidatus Aminicenantes bacterium]|jgi:ABC-type cobalamin/Fe3+-siderophores transport systems, ATPase components|nr:ABC transporter ATP-binding protein [Candidatus Aminicenantes bacterium]
MLKVKELSAGYGQTEVLKNISADFYPGEITAVLGPNGSGKTTLFRTLVRLIKPRQGQILLYGQNLEKLSSKLLAQEVAYLPQLMEIAGNTTVFEAILLGRKPYLLWDTSARDLAVVEKVIRWLRLEEFAFKTVSELSGGEKQKVLLARALAQEPRVLLLDEPTNNLDPKNQLEILKLVRDLTWKEKLITVMSVHDLSLALRFAQRFILMKEGKIYYQGQKEIISRETLQDIFEAGLEVINYEGRTLIL